MMTIDRNNPPTLSEVEAFLKGIDFKLPIGFIDFFKNTNGASINSVEKYILLWALTDRRHRFITLILTDHYPRYTTVISKFRLIEASSITAPGRKKR